MDKPFLPPLSKMGKKNQTCTWLRAGCNFQIVIVVLGAVLVTITFFDSIGISKKLQNIKRPYWKNDTNVDVDHLSNRKNNTGDDMDPLSSRKNDTDPLLSWKNSTSNDVDPLSSLSSCDFFSGKWVYDNESRPLYRDSSCEFMFDDLACEKYGRKDLDYQYWRWQPHECDLPRFDSILLLEKLKNKRIVFVGDSVNRNQWVSMVCMVESSIPKAFKHRSLIGPLYTFKATEYNATIDFYWAPLLVESNSDDPSNHRLPDRIVKIGAIEKHAKHWSDADILVFNSYLWWKVPKLKIQVGSSGNKNQTYKEVGYIRCYTMALKTWSNWLDVHLNRAKTQVFFVSMAPTHDRAEDWGMSKGKNCLKESEPISRNGYRGSKSDPKMMRITEAAITKLKVNGVNIKMLNITQLSEYRKDGHPTIYRKQWHPLTKEQLSNPLIFADCTHWCLPGVPDVWNELLFTYILYFQ